MSRQVVRDARMVRSLASRILFLGASCLAVSACSDLIGTNVKIVTMEVAATRVPCQGLVPMECIQVRQAPAADWNYFYDPIEGFDYEPGFEYTIRVAVTAVANPPADASSATYRLVELLRKEPV